jgi:hypothetical protein
VFVSPIEPLQQLDITWGNQSFYPERAPPPPPDDSQSDATAQETVVAADPKVFPATVQSSYSRSTSGGATRLQIVSDDHGTRLYPAATCVVGARPEDSNSEAKDKQVLTPYPQGVNSLFGNWFVPVYNTFDLHNSMLLLAASAGRAKPKECPEIRAGPRYLYLLTPSAYVKADSSSLLAQFENEARLGPSDDPSLSDPTVLARQFIILGCNSSRPEDVQNEWNLLLQSVAKGTAEPRGDCGQFAHAVFGAKTFLELRNQFSVNGSVVEEGAYNLSTIGQVIGTGFGSRLNLDATPESGPRGFVKIGPDRLFRASNRSCAHPLLYYEERRA